MGRRKRLRCGEAELAAARAGGGGCSAGRQTVLLRGRGEAEGVRGGGAGCGAGAGRRRRRGEADRGAARAWEAELSAVRAWGGGGGAERWRGEARVASAWGGGRGCCVRVRTGLRRGEARGWELLRGVYGSGKRCDAEVQRQCRESAECGEADLIIRRIERRHDETGTVEPGSGDERVDGICANFAAALVTA